MSMERWWNGTGRGKLTFSERNLSHTTLFTANPTRNAPDLKAGNRGGRPATNYLGHGTVFGAWESFSHEYCPDIRMCVAFFEGPQPSTFSRSIKNNNNIKTAVTVMLTGERSDKNLSTANATPFGPRWNSGLHV